LSRHRYEALSGTEQGIVTFATASAHVSNRYKNRHRER